MIKIHDVDQRSTEWFDLRKKYPLTASKGLAIATNGSGLETLCWESVVKRMSLNDEFSYTNDNTERGNELEQDALAVYELETGNTVGIIGFITDEDISKVGGASPDGWIGEDGNLEIKCPSDVKFLKLLAEYKQTGTVKVESGYYNQMQMQMLFGNRKWTDYVMFNPNFKENIIIVRVLTDPVTFEKIKIGLKKGEEIINEIENKLK